MNPKFIKVDTVGVDQPVLEGAYKLLRDSAVPSVIANCYCGIASILLWKRWSTLKKYFVPIWKNIAILAISRLSGGSSADFRPGTSHG